MTKEEKIISIINKAIENKIIYGASYSFIYNNYDNSSYYCGVYGEGEEFKNKKVDENSIYDIASLTKVIGTTSIILKLIDNKILKLNDKAQKFCNDFQDESITIEELLLHNSSLKADLSDKSNVTIAQIFDRELITKEKKTVYSDIGFIILGFIIEKVTNLTLDKAFKNILFEKINMHNTSYYPNNRNNCIPTEYNSIRGLIVGEAHDSKAFQLKEIGSAGLFSTLNDLIIFSTLFLKRDKNLISSESIEYLLNTNIGNRTLGWDKKYGDKILYHTGFTGTSILLNLEKNEAMILLTNRIHLNRNNSQFIDIRESINKIFLED